MTSQSFRIVQVKEPGDMIWTRNRSRLDRCKQPFRRYSRRFYPCLGYDLSPRCMFRSNRQPWKESRWFLWFSLGIYQWSISSDWNENETFLSADYFLHWQSSCSQQRQGSWCDQARRIIVDRRWIRHDGRRTRRRKQQFIYQYSLRASRTAIHPETYSLRTAQGSPGWFQSFETVDHRVDELVFGLYHRSFSDVLRRTGKVSYWGKPFATNTMDCRRSSSDILGWSLHSSDLHRRTSGRIERWRREWYCRTFQEREQGDLRKLELYASAIFVVSEWFQVDSRMEVDEIYEDLKKDLQSHINLWKWRTNFLVSWQGNAFFVVTFSLSDI